MRLFLILLATALPCVRMGRYLKGKHHGAALISFASLSALSLSLWLLIRYLSSLANAGAISTIYDTTGALSIIYGIFALVTLVLNFVSLLPTILTQKPKEQ